MNIDDLLSNIDSNMINTIDQQSFSGDMKNSTIDGIYHTCQLDTAGEIRVLKLTSPKVSVLTLFFYPKETLALPVFAAEFVDLNGKRFITAIDSPSLFTDKSSEVSTLIRNTFELLFSDTRAHDEMPAWYQDCSSEYAVFSSSSDRDHFEVLYKKGIECWERVVQCLLTHIKTSTITADDQVTTHKRQIQEYKHHHHINSPGLPLMNRCFGEAWVEKFMTKDFFA